MQDTPVLTRSFFDEQARRRRQTYFFVALGVVWMAIMGSLVVAAHESLLRQMMVSHAEIRQWCMVASGIAVGLWGLVALVLLLWASRVLPVLMGARPATGLDKRTLANVTEEISLGAGETPEKVRWYVLEIASPNAFACGRSVPEGSIMVTRGLLDMLDRDELQAVVAHELAHLKNGDAQFIVSALAFAWMVIGLSVAGCVVLALAAAILGLFVFIIAKVAEGSDNGIVGLVAVLVGLGVFIYGMVLLAAYALGLAMLIGLVAIGVKAASSSISQSREYLADACSAQWTRKPWALASALAKVCDAPRMVSSKADMVAPLWLDHPGAEKGDGFRHRLFCFLLNTHPSVERRLELLGQMTGSIAVTDARWLLAIRPSRWERFKEWALPVFATILAIALAVMLIQDYIH